MKILDTLKELSSKGIVLYEHSSEPKRLFLVMSAKAEESKSLSF